MHLPSSLLDHLRETTPGFSNETPRDQLSLALTLWACAESGRPHKVWPDMFSFSNDDIREIWGDDARMRRVVGYRYFTVHQGSNLSEMTNAYAPSIQLAEALVRTCKERRADDWIDDQRRPWAPSGNAIASMAAPAKSGDGNRQTKWKDAKPEKFIPINVVALRSYREELVFARMERPLVAKAGEWIRRQVRSIDIALKVSQNARHPGCFPIKYREGSTGRINAQGHSLQSMPGLVRSAALAGGWDYDISTCQWTILAQMASRFGINCPLTDAYIADKRTLRRKVSEGAGISLDEAKTCITALLFGAVVQQSEKAMRLHPGDLVKDIKVQAALRLSKQPDFMALYAEIRRVGDAIVKAWPRNNGRVFNDLHIKYSSGSKLAHLLQGAEAAALRAVVTQHQSNILLCVHDGWVTRERLDVDVLAGQIETTTGYRLRIESSRLEVPGRDQIKRQLDEFEAFSEGELEFECLFAVPQGEQGRRVDSGSGPDPSSTSSSAGLTPSDDALLWTSYPHPSKSVLAKLGLVSPRPGWNLPPGSTADFIDRKRRNSSAATVKVDTGTIGGPLD